MTSDRFRAVLLGALAFFVFTVSEAHGYVLGGPSPALCTLAPGVLQLSIAGDDTRVCGDRLTHGSITSVTDASSASTCTDIPGAAGGGSTSLLLQWDASVGAAGEWKCITGASDVALQDAITANSHTGILTGGEITADTPTTFNLAAGTGIIADWTDTANPVYINVTWPEQLGITAAGIGSTIFTTLAIDATGTLIQRAGGQLTPQERRLCIELYSVVHPDQATITRITENAIPAYGVTKSIIDYIDALGPVNSGNGYEANGVNLAINKVPGLTTFPFINYGTDRENPTNRTDPSESALANMVFNYQDGAGGVVTVPGQSAIDPEFYDDGSGVLAAVGNNRWQIQRFFFFSQTQDTLIAYGQATYGNAGLARAAIFTEAFTVNPIIPGNGTMTTVLLVKKGTTDLSDENVAEFVPISAGATSSGSFSPNVNPVIDHVDFDIAVDAAVTSLPDGLLATPSISWASSLTTGLRIVGGRVHYGRSGVDIGELAGYASFGTNMLTYTDVDGSLNTVLNSGVDIANGRFTLRGLRVFDGSDALDPSYSFSTAPTTGLWLSAGEMQYTVGGTNRGSLLALGASGGATGRVPVFGALGVLETFGNFTYDGDLLLVGRVDTADRPGSNSHSFYDNDSTTYDCSGVILNNITLFTDSNRAAKMLMLCNTDGTFVIPRIEADGTILAPNGFESEPTQGKNKGKNMGAVATFNLVTDGELEITIDGVSNDITGLNFSAASDYDDIAAIVQAAIRAIGTGGFTLAEVEHDGTGVKATIFSGTTGATSQIEPLTDPILGGTYVGGASYLRLGSGDAVLTDGSDQGDLFKTSSASLSTSFIISTSGDDGVRHPVARYRGAVTCDGVSGCGVWNSKLRIGQYGAGGGADLMDRITAEWLGPVQIRRGEDNNAAYGIEIADNNDVIAGRLRPVPGATFTPEWVLPDVSGTLNLSYAEQLEAVCNSESLPLPTAASDHSWLQWDYPVTLTTLSCLSGSNDIDVDIQVCDADGVTSCASSMTAVNCSTAQLTDTATTAVTAGRRVVVNLANDTAPSWTSIKVCHTKELVE